MLRRAMSAKGKLVAVFSYNSSLWGARMSLMGVAEWARRNTDWRFAIQEHRIDEQSLAAQMRGADGIIVSAPILAANPQSFPRDVPTIVTEPFPKGAAGAPWLEGRAQVRVDSRRIGRLAAEYYLERRYESFAYVADTLELQWDAERRDGFRERLAEAGCGCAVYEGFTKRERSSWIAERPRMMAWLAALPKPTAVFAAMDGRARLVLDACAEAGIAVPVEIAVLGVDDDPLLCEMAHPRLSSIRENGFLRGQKDAEMLAALMDGRRPARMVAVIPPGGVETRESTGHRAMTNPFLAKGLVFIRDTAGGRALGVGDVVSAMGCSRRMAERLFSDGIGRTVKDEIERVRFDTVRKLLRTTSLPIAEIAARCAFPDESGLSRRFLALFGETPSRWRRQNSR